MRRRVFCLYLLLASLPPLSAGTDPIHQDSLLIKGGDLIDGTGNPLTRNVWILIENESIARVGKAGAFRRPPGSRILKARGMTILPGLIDAHVHLTASGVVGYSFHSAQPRGYPVYLRNLKSELIGGVTLVRDLNLPLPLAHRLSEAAREDPTLGARLVFSGPILAAVDGYGSPYSTPVVSPEDGRMQVRKLIEEGAGVIKVAVTKRDFAGTVLQSLSPETLKGIVDEAHAHGVPVAAHVAGAALAELKTAVDAGVDSLEHMPGVSGPLKMPDVFYSDSGLLPDILSKGITIVPTLSVEAGDDFGPTVRELWDDPLLLLKLDPEQRATLARNIDDFSHNASRQATARAGKERMALFLQEVRKLHSAGIRLGVGTDAGNGLTFHGNLFTEIEYLHQGGLSPQEAIEAATRGNAELLRVAKMAGTIEEGKWADLVLVRGNPLEDLDALHRVEKVIIAGRILDVAQLLKDAQRQEKLRSRTHAPAR